MRRWPVTLLAAGAAASISLRSSWSARKRMRASAALCRPSRVSRRHSADRTAAGQHAWWYVSPQAACRPARTDGTIEVKYQYQESTSRP